MVVTVHEESRCEDVLSRLERRQDCAKPSCTKTAQHRPPRPPQLMLMMLARRAPKSTPEAIKSSVLNF